MSQTIASAVAIIPDDSELDSGHNGLKRRQSDASQQEDSSKRRRTSAGKDSPPDPQATNTDRDTQPGSPNYTTKTAPKAEDRGDARRRSTAPDDKQRSKRLFGALLGNLNASQPNDRAAKRRADIEARRKAELAKQDNERLEDKQRRLRELAQQRKKQQIYVDEQDMRTRHRNLLDMANMLHTEAEPKLYYRPWDLLGEQETRIEEQLEKARNQIDEERKAFEADKKKRLAALNGNVDDENSRSDTKSPQPQEAVAPQGGTEKPTNVESADSEPASNSTDPDNQNANGDKPSEAIAKSDVRGETGPEAAEKPDGVHEKQEEADEDDVVEADEDNVIY